MDISTLLQQGIAAAKAGKKEEARSLLMQVIEADERNEQGWLWLAGVVDEAADMRTCLENVLALNPDNKQARKGMAWLDERHGPVVAEHVDPIQSTPASYSQATISDTRSTPVTGPTVHLSDSQSAATWSEPAREIQFSDVQPEAPVARWSQTAPPAAPPSPEPRSLPAMMGSEPDIPCPYCGAPTALSQKHCLKCKRDLSLRLQGEEKRSLVLTIFGGIYWLQGILITLSGLLRLVDAVFLQQQAQAVSRSVNNSSGALVVATIGVVLLLIGGGLIYLGWSLHQRARWAYYVAAVLTGFGVLGTCALLGVSAGLLAFLSDSMSIDLKSRLGGVMLGYLLGTVLQVLMMASIYREFFGQKQRFIPSFPNAEHAIHYNNGVAYKNRGMWYMAMREWEGAINKAPNNVTYLHALGLAYAQLQRFDQARSTLDKAVEYAPAERQLRESRELVEKMAAKSA